MLCALGKEHELKLHIRGALNNGLTKDEIKEVFLQVAIYCGVPPPWSRSAARRKCSRVEDDRFIGLGVMGKLMAANLEAAGYAVQSYDSRRRATEIGARGGCGADALITMLPDGDAVRDAVLDALPALKRGAVVVDMSSSDPAGTRALGDALKRAISGWSMRRSRARVQGEGRHARDHGGRRERAFRQGAPLLQKLGNQIFHVGPLGAGHAVKALNNYLGAAGTLAGFEALLIAQAFGLDPVPMLDAINASTGRNSTTARKIRRTS